MKRLWKMLAPVLLGFVLAGCVGQVMRVDAVEEPGSVDRTRGRKIKAWAQSFQLLAVVPIGTNTRHDRAYQELREQAGNDVIADIKIREYWAYGVVGTALITELEAMAYPRKRQLQP